MPVKRAEKTPMPAREASARAHDFGEVNEGYTLFHAAFEAERCLRCQDPVCVEGCPVRIPIPDFIHQVANGDMPEAARLLRAANPLPAICGRVCPQESQCELNCSLGTRFKPVAIGHLERYVADWERAQPPRAHARAAREETIAVVGGGPAGLCCAGELARLGYPVTLYEALHAPGGVLRYGIPEFRLPKEILDWEIGVLGASGVEIVCDVIVGKTLALEQLTARFSAVFIGTGAGLPQFLGIPGENLNGVMSANEFLTRVNLMRAYAFPEADTPVAIGARVAVVGAGNTAMDAARTALRIGAQEATIVYRRGEREMSARVEEYHHAIEEGVRFRWLTSPIEVQGGEDGRVTGLRCRRMALGAPDASGRARPVPVDGPDEVIPIDSLVLAIGTTPNPMLTRAASGLMVDARGCILADERTGRTAQPEIYAGGDAVTGAATVILAAGAGKRAAQAIHEALEAKRRPGDYEAIAVPRSSPTP